MEQPVMRILYIVPYTPNQIRVRPYNLIRSLARRGHAVTLATLWQDDGEQDDLRELESQGVRVVARQLGRLRPLWNSLVAAPSAAPLQARYCWHPGLAQAIAQLVQQERFDAIHVEHLRGAAYGLHVKRLLQRRQNSPNLQSPISTPPIIWDSVDCISHLFAQAASHSRSLKSRLMTRLELPATRRYEGWLAQQFDHVLVTSPIDKVALESLRARQDPKITASHPPISVLPNGVDAMSFAPGQSQRKPATLVVSGKMSYHANVTMVLHLANDIMPIIWRQRPDVQLWIVGKDPVTALTQLDPQWMPGRSVDELLSLPRKIVVTGAVTTLTPFLQNATVAVAPLLYGAGIQNKVLEAMACGAPVVASPQVIAALTAQSETGISVADTPGKFADAVLDLISDQQKSSLLGQTGRVYVELNHDWEKIVARLEASYILASNRDASHDRSQPLVLHQSSQHNQMDGE